MMIVTRVAREITRGRTETGLLKLVLSVGGPPGEAEGERGEGGRGGKVMMSSPTVVTGESVAAKVVALVSSIVVNMVLT